jgi:hypothetical protein
MFRTEKTVGMLKAIALIAGLAILLWSLGLPSLRFADAANITSVSDTLSDSAPSAPSDHTITFTSPTGIVNGATTTITFQAGFDLSAIDFTDIDMASTSDYTVAGDCSGAANVAATTSGQVLSLIFCLGDNGYLNPGATTTIQIGQNAVGGIANAQITNPPSVGSYDIDITAGPSDSGGTVVAIIDSVLVTASVDTIFQFSVSGLPTGSSVNGDTTTGNTTTTTIPFGTLTGGSATTSAQRLSVVTNASRGYVVTVQLDGSLQSSTGADIDSFVDGSATDTPTTWSSPTGVISQENTWGHWGVTSDDATTTRSATDEFGLQEYIGADTSPRVVMSHDGPVNGVGVGVGTTTVGYKVEITNLQEAGDDYEATVTYIATPTF